MNDKIRESEPLMVSIRCLVYNHEPYIRECLEGFVMQKTNFRFEAIVHDDASTDGSAAIIKEYAEKYPDIIKPIFEKENKYSKHDGSLKRIMDEHTYGKYVALCEGDDYWIDPLKLQKQVDYMEEHSECSLCFHAHKNECKGKMYTIRQYDNIQNQCPMQDIILGGGGFMATNSMVYRKSKLPVEEPYWSRNTPVGDLPLMLKLASSGDVAYLDRVMSVYRICVPGSWTATSKTFHYQIRLIRRMDHLWKGYDEWTNFKYHTQVMKMRRDNIAGIFMFTLSYLKRKALKLFN